MVTAIDAWTSLLSRVREEYPFGPCQIKLDADGRKHCLTGPAVITPTSVACFVAGRRHGYYADVYGTVLYYYRGVLVPTAFFTKRDSLTPEKILQHPNQEVRRVGMELYGYDNLRDYLKLIHSDPRTGAELFRMKIDDEDPLVLVKVLDSTELLSGSRKTYWLQVPPNMRTCQQAIAWTFSMSEGEYAPDVES